MAGMAEPRFVHRKHLVFRRRRCHILTEITAQARLGAALEQHQKRDGAGESSSLPDR